MTCDYMHTVQLWSNRFVFNIQLCFCSSGDLWIRKNILVRHVVVGMLNVIDFHYDPGNSYTKRIMFL